jgi:spermidine/putrescine-binding protein
MENKLSDTESLRLTAEEFLRTIKNGDIQGFIEFLDDEGEIVIDVDTYMTKSQIANDLYRKGEIYCFVFDETKCKNTRIKKSIKKLFSTAKEIKINVAPISDIGEHLAIVEFIWDGKPPEFLDPWFKLTPKGWKLVNLFATN